MTLWEQALDTLASYFVITEVESSEQKPRTSDWSRFAVLSTKLNIEQARVALLMKDSASFADSLARGSALLAELTSSNDDPLLSTIKKELADLSAISLRLELPTLESLKLINDESGRSGDEEISSAPSNLHSGDQLPAGDPE